MELGVAIVESFSAYGLESGSSVAWSPFLKVCLSVSECGLGSIFYLESFSEGSLVSS